MAEIDEKAERRASLVNASVCKGKLLLLWVAALILLISAVCVYFRHGNLMYDYSKGGKTIAFIDIFSSQTGYYMKTFIPLLLPIVLIATVIFITVITKTFNAKLDLYVLITVTVLLTLTLVIACVCNVRLKSDSSAYRDGYIDGYIWVKGNKSYYSEFRFEPGMLAALILYLSSGTAFLIFLISVLSGLNEDTPEEKLFFAGRVPSEFNQR